MPGIQRFYLDHQREERRRGVIRDPLFRLHRDMANACDTPPHQRYFDTRVPDTDFVTGRIAAPPERSVVPALPSEQSGPKFDWSFPARPLSSAWALAVTAGIGSIVLFHDIVRDPLSRSVGAGDGVGADAIQSMWFLHWVPWALLQGRNPLFTDAIDAPGSISLAWNTPVPTLGLLASPVTMTAGPTLAYNLILVLAPVLTALTARYWLMRYVTEPLAAGIAGLVIGFGPFMAGHLQGHANLAFLALVPLILALTDDLLRGRTEHPYRTAGLLGALTAAQVGISEEVLLIVALGAGACLVGIVVCQPRETGLALRRGWHLLALAIGVAMLLSAPILVTQLFLSPHISVPGSTWHAVPSDFVMPTDRFVTTWGRAFAVGEGRDFNTFEQTAYIGYPMIVLLAVIVLRLGSDWRVRLGAVLCAGAALLALGTGEDSNGTLLPWSLLRRLPFLDNILPVRFTLVVLLATGFLVALAWDQVASVTRLAPRRTLLLGLVLCLLTWAPSPIRGHDLTRVAAFSEGVPDVAPRSIVLVLPSARPAANHAQLWQSDADFKFRTYGGYALHLDDRGHTTQWPTPSPVIRTTDAVREGRPITNDEIVATRDQLAKDGASAIVVVKSMPRAEQYQQLAQHVTGRAADQETGEVLVWRLDGQRPT